MNCLKLAISSISLASFLAISCTSGQNKGAEMTATMEDVDETAIPLDSTTTQEFSYLQQLDDSTIIFLNRPTFELCKANVLTGAMERIQLQNSGPNAVNGIDAFCYVSPDSIWLFASWGGKLFLIDSEGTKIAQTALPVTEPDGSLPGYTVAPFPRTTSPYAVIGNTQILQGWGRQPEEPGQTMGTTMIFDASDETATTGNPYPEYYGTTADEISEWDLMGYQLTGYTLTPALEILTNFPASDSLYLFNPKTLTRKAYFAGHSEPTNIRKVSFDDQEGQFTYYLSQYRYAGVVYDKFNDVYYRFLYHPVEDYDKDDLRTEFFKMPLSVIILDNEFNVIGEADLPRDVYYLAGTFVTPKGLHIQVLSDDDDFMKFRVFKINR